MKIPYSKTRTLSTSELPGVLSHPPLKFEFPAAPTFEQMQALTKWSMQSDPARADTIRLASEFLLAVLVPPKDERYELATPAAINELIEQTEFSFIVNLLKGWQTRIALERIKDLGNSRASLLGSNGNDAENSPAGELSAS